MFGFDWDEANLTHIALHGVTREEAEEVLLGFTDEVDSYEVDGEERLEEIGFTSAGRILKVVTTLRCELVRVVTAYEPGTAIRARYMNIQRRLYE